MAMDALWEAVQEGGKYNGENGRSEPWGFTWGAENMGDLRKALATIMREEFIDTWLASPSEAFPSNPQKAIKEGRWEEVWLAILEIGTKTLS